MPEIVTTGPFSWDGSVDEEGHRDYTVVYRVKGDVRDGPASILNTPGLPLPGSVWQIDNDFDAWAFCKFDTRVSPEMEGAPNEYWKVTKNFSTRPFRRCSDTDIENPLLEPQKISGDFNKFTREEIQDRFGKYLLTSSHELFRGPQVEFDRVNPIIKIEQNVAILDWTTVVNIMSPPSVNGAPLWGFPARTIKISGARFEEKYWGTCFRYYMRSFEFEVNYETWDRFLLDEGTKVLNGYWDTATGNWVLLDINGQPPDPDNPQHFNRFKDRRGENADVILNGAGLPSGVSIGLTGTGTVTGIGTRFVQRYPEADFLLSLGIPAVIGP